MPIPLLKELGFTDSEIKVYLALLELGSTTKGPIVAKSGVASSKIYELLDKLQRRGLVSAVIRSSVKYFESAHPSRLLDYVKEKEATLLKHHHQLEKLIPMLETKRSLAGLESETQVFKGIKGAETAYGDVLRQLKQGDEYFSMGIAKFPPSFEKFLLQFHNKRCKAGIQCRIVANEIARNRLGKKFEALPYTKVRYMDKDLFTPVAFVIYKDKTIVSIGWEEIFIQIRSKSLADSLRTYANYLFLQGKK